MSSVEIKQVILVAVVGLILTFCMHAYEFLYIFAGRVWLIIVIQTTTDRPQRFRR